jgi:hypothetical protein
MNMDRNKVSPSHEGRRLRGDVRRIATDGGSRGVPDESARLVCVWASLIISAGRWP